MRPKLYLYFHGIGDSLLFSTALYYLGRQTGRKYLVGSQYPEIYHGNPYVRHLPCKTHGSTVQWRRLLSASKLVSGVEYINYNEYGPIPPRHIFTLLCERIGLVETPSHPLIFLTPEEKKQRFLPKSDKPWIAIQSTGNTVHTEYKNWNIDKFQEVVSALRERYAIAQFGLSTDPPLNVDVNLCGKLTTRQLFVTFRECCSFVGLEGFLMHVAATVNIPSVIIFGGFSAPWQTGYVQNCNIYNPVSCAPCWLWKTRGQCSHFHRCMTEIGSQQVVGAFERLMAKIGSNHKSLHVSN